MLNLERTEKLILAILVFTLFVGLALLAYQRSRPLSVVEIGAFDSDYRQAGTAGEELPKININKADAEELMALKGIGKTIAERIVEYRSLKGPFVSIDDIKNVKGIGKAMLDKIKDRISVE